MKQKTIGLNPLEEYLSKGKEPKEQVRTVQEETADLALLTQMVSAVVPEQKIEQQPEQQMQGKQRITLHISAEVVDRVKNAVYWEPGLTIASFAEEALEKALLEIEAQRGSPFPKRREHKLRGGRPMI